MISRNIEDKLLELLLNHKKDGLVLILEGVRQVGKTTLVRQLLKKADLPFLELNLERDPTSRDEIDQSKDFDDFTEWLALKFKFKKDKVLFIDEAQESEKLGSYVRFMKEDWSSPVILTGSSMSRLIHGRYPVGRVSSFELQAFSFFEFLDACGETELLQKLRKVSLQEPPSERLHSRALECFSRYCEIGGMPAVVNSYAANGDWMEVLRQLQSGFRADFRRVFSDGDAAYLWAGLQATALLEGQPFHNSYVSKILQGGTPAKVVEALSRLDQWRMALPVHQRSLMIEASAHPKRYLFDHGMARLLRSETTVGALVADADRRNQGGFLEGIVFHMLRQRYREIVGWRKGPSGSEVDFAISHEGQVVLIEVKATARLKGTHLSGLLSLMSLQSLQSAFVASLAPLEVRKIHYQGRDLRIINLPVYLTERLHDFALH